MSDSYLDGKVREALIAAKGSRSLAQNILMKWAITDDRLLKAMAQPFIKAISGAAIAGAIKRGVSVPGLSAPPARPAPKLSQSDLMQVLSQLGHAEDDAAEGKGGGLSVADILGGDTTPAKPTAPQRRSPGGTSAKPVQPADQASAIRTLAAVYARNRKRP